MTAQWDPQGGTSFSDFPDGVWGGMNSTDLAPKIVLPAMCTVALEGM